MQLKNKARQLDPIHETDTHQKFSILLVENLLPRSARRVAASGQGFSCVTSRMLGLETSSKAEGVWETTTVPPHSLRDTKQR